MCSFDPGIARQSRVVRAATPEEWDQMLCSVGLSKEQQVREELIDYIWVRSQCRSNIKQEQL